MDAFKSCPERQARQRNQTIPFYAKGSLGCLHPPAAFFISLNANHLPGLMVVARRSFIIIIRKPFKVFQRDDQGQEELLYAIPPAFGREVFLWRKPD